MVVVVWDLTKPLPDRRVNEKVVIKPVSLERLREVGEILVVTWGGFIKSPDVTEKRVGPYLSAGLEQPFIAYLGSKAAGCVSPKMDVETKVGVLDGGVHVLPEFRRQRVGTALLLTALRWLKSHGMKEAKVWPFNPEGEAAVKRAIAFYVSNGGEMREDNER